jgi:transposase
VGEVLCVGIDQSEKHQDVWMESGSGKRLKEFRISQDVQGLTRFQEIVAELEPEPSQVLIAIESSQGPFVNALIASDYRVYVVNPLTSARAREGQSLASAKSDRADARMLANLVRTNRQQLRPVAGDSEEAEEIRIRARSHVRAIRMQQRLRNQLRSCLLQFYLGALPLLAEGEDLRDALAVLAVAPTPETGRRLSRSKLEATLRRHGRQRNVAAKAVEIQDWLRQPQLELGLPKVVSAHRDEVVYLVRTLLQVRSEVQLLEQQLSASFEGHPDAEIYLSLAGLGTILGARVLGESGDDPTRYVNARARKNYVGNSPITVASGKRRSVGRRIARNRLLADASFRWALSALTASPGARRYYDQLVGRGRTHNEALRALANRLIGILHGCLRTRRLYDESLAWTSQLEEAA